MDEGDDYYEYDDEEEGELPEVIHTGAAQNQSRDDHHDDLVGKQIDACMQSIDEQVFQKQELHQT